MLHIRLGEYLETFIEAAAEKGEPFFDAVSVSIETIVKSFQKLLYWPEPMVMIIFFTILSYCVIARKKGLLNKKGLKSAWGMSVFTFLGMSLLYNLGLWEDTLQTLALVITSTLIALIIGIPLGIAASRHDCLEKVVKPVLDLMQTLPAFVYLIPAILFFSVGDVPGVVATVVFALPPAVRLTNLGIRGVQEDVIEASKAFGATEQQLLIKVQIPLALPTIMAGINQVIMLALSMVVIASMVGAGGLGERVYTGILQADIGLGFEAGLGIVIIAIFLDRITQSFGMRKDR
ncbi:MAG: proline/glycine betaine ABC transporter permease [Victivallales bacterium]|nr:proline/glycine betaine ABC transporter permease [Victivallales bacterium]